MWDDMGMASGWFSVRFEMISDGFVMFWVGVGMVSECCLNGFQKNLRI